MSLKNVVFAQCSTNNFSQTYHYIDSIMLQAMLSTEFQYMSLKKQYIHHTVLNTVIQTDITILDQLSCSSAKSRMMVFATGEYVLYIHKTA